SSIRIGVVDTGVDFGHPDLRPCLAHGINLLKRNALPHDDNGHGTHITGTIAAFNQRHGIMGVAPRATVYPVKAFDRHGIAHISDIILGIHWCIDNRMDIINMSFGMKTRNTLLLQAIRHAYRAGILVVASSGNDGITKAIDYPARFLQTISVGATSRNKTISSFSNRGKGIDIFAPGERIYSTWLGGRYNELSGTSMAASHVTGTLALILALKPGIRPSHMKSMIRKTVHPYKLRYRDLYSTKRHIINVLNLLKYI
ncbi:MAG TPA: S8 family peptidase, partial [Bacilli bacterium]